MLKLDEKRQPELQDGAVIAPKRTALKAAASSFSQSVAAERKASPRPKATFNLEPEYIFPAPQNNVTRMENEELTMEDLTEAELKLLKEQNQRRVKRIVAAVGITLTLVSIILVALSLSLGQKIDQLGKFHQQLSRWGPHIGMQTTWFLIASVCENLQVTQRPRHTLCHRFG